MTPPTVTKEEALAAFRTLGKILQETYDVPQEDLLSELTLSIPVRIFRSDVTAFQAIASYLSQEGLTPKKIAKILGRNKNFVTASIVDVSFETDGPRVPIEHFQTELSVLESTVWSLAQRSMSNNEIAEEIGKTTSAVWTLRKRAAEKRGESDA